MKGILDARSIDIPCPRCGQKTAQTVGWLKANDHFACPGCKATINLDRDNLLDGIRVAEDSIQGFKDMVRRIGKRR